MTVLLQIFRLIPRNLIPKHAREYGVDKQARDLLRGSASARGVFWVTRTVEKWHPESFCLVEVLPWDSRRHSGDEGGPGTMLLAGLCSGNNLTRQK